MADKTTFLKLVDLLNKPAIKKTKIIFTNSDGWKVKNFPIGIASLAPLSVLPTAKTNASKAIPTKQ